MDRVIADPLMIAEPFPRHLLESTVDQGNVDNLVTLGFWSRDFVGAGPELPARTSRHGSPGGIQWYEVRGRGDDWYDWDTNCFHFMGGAPRDASFTEYEPHTMDWHFPEWLKANGLTAPPRAPR